MTRWPLPLTQTGGYPSMSESASIIFAGVEEIPIGIDALTGATVLDLIKTQLGQGQALPEIFAISPFGYIAGSGWEWGGAAFALGGLWLVAGRMVDWRIPLAMLGGLLLPAATFHFYAPLSYASPAFHLLAGATLIGAFFIATDPVSASTTPRGRWIYGAGIGCLTYLIRVFGGYPDGVAFAVLLMNLAAPAIDYFTPLKRAGER